MAGNWTIQDEIDHFNGVYGPYIMQRALKLREKVKNNPSFNHSNPTVVVSDMSHSNLYFYRGMIRTAKENKNKMSLQFMRIRRDRIETIISMSSDRTFFEHELAVFHPHVNAHDVVLTVSPSLWTHFSLYQKTLWVIDETEARWRKVAKECPGRAGGGLTTR